MTVQLLGASRLTELMRAERRRDLDTSWMLFGPGCDEEAPAQQPVADPLRFAAE